MFKCVLGKSLVCVKSNNKKVNMSNWTLICEWTILLVTISFCLTIIPISQLTLILLFICQVRLSLPPLLRLYSEAIKSGDSSLSIAFEMLGNLVGTMDRTSVGAYHAKIFDLCLLALDLRRQKPLSVRNVDDVEKNVINAMIVLTMKLTETMFKPLFIRSIEWSESNVEESESAGSTNIDRALSFYGLVNKLAESHR